MGNPLIVQIVLGLLFVFFCVLTYFCTKTWRALHVVALFLTFVMTFVLVVMACLTLKTHATWKRRYDSLQTQLTRAQEDGQILSSGYMVSVDYKKLAEGRPAGEWLIVTRKNEETSDELSARFNRLMYERGRVWRQCQALGFQNNTLELKVVPDNAPAGTTHGIQDKMVVFAFLQNIDLNGDGTPDASDTNGDGRPDAYMPGGYVGEFRVTASTPTNVTITPTIPLDQAQLRLTQQQAFWTLYEMMPLDGHNPFATVGTPEYVEPDPTAQQPLFGTMDPNDIRQLFQAVVLANGIQFNEQQATSLLQPYTRDGLPLDEGEVAALDPLNVWYLVEFDKKHEVEVDNTRPSLSDTSLFYDPDGLSLVPRLMRGEKVTFEPSQLAIFATGSEDVDEGGSELKKDDLDDLRDSGITKSEMTPFYVRRLNGFRQSLQEMYMRTQKILEDSRVAQRNTDRHRESLERTNRNLVYRREERGKLDGSGLPEGELGELPGFQQEVSVLDSLLAGLEARRTEAVQRLSELYQTNQVLERKLAEVQALLADEINQKTAEAASDASGD